MRLHFWWGNLPHKPPWFSCNGTTGVRPGFEVRHSQHTFTSDEPSKKGPNGCWRVYGGWETTQFFYGTVVNHSKDPVIKQSLFHGRSGTPFFCSDELRINFTLKIIILNWKGSLLNKIPFGFTHTYHHISSDGSLQKTCCLGNQNLIQKHVHRIVYINTR